MKDLLQKLPLKENTSFVCRSYRTPYFETPWHYHAEYEIAVITHGNGDVLVGDYLGKYEAGDVFFLGGNLPHWFRKNDPAEINCAVVIQFKDSFVGNTFWNLPETEILQQLLVESTRGFQLKGDLKTLVTSRVIEMENAEGYPYLRSLFDCLYDIAQRKADRIPLTLTGIQNYHDTETLIAKVFEYTFAHFQDEIKVDDLAKLSNMSVSSFMRFFKGNTKKTYSQFVKEVRIAHACTLLAKTHKPVSNICSESGYNSWANFTRQFREIKGMSPSDYRKKMFA